MSGGDWATLAEASRSSGLRIVLLRNGVPSPWGQAARALFEIKGLPFQRAARMTSDPPELLAEWSGQSSFPVVAWNRERPRSGWAEILLLAERLAPQPALIPADPRERALMFGLAHEICGEEGLGWCHRLVLLAPALMNPTPPPEMLEFGLKYGFTPEALRAAPKRVLAVLGLLADQLRRQRAQGRRYLVGDALSALDVYWAAFSNLFVPLPPEQLPVTESVRAMLTTRDAEVLKILESGLLAHRDFVFRTHLRLPVEL